MKALIVVVLALLTGASTICGRLGDRADVIDDAYGDVVQRHLLDDGRLNIVYHSGRYLYSVIFANGRSVLERYSHENGRGLSAKEISKFLKANAGGATWIPENATQQRFKRSDGKAEATYSDESGRLALTVRQVRADHSGTNE